MASAYGEPDTDGPRPATRSGAAAASLIGLGIFLSRIIGLVRERMLATYFGTGLHADVFSAGLRLPNLLQNLLGEGTLSASFIPAYSALLGRAGRPKPAALRVRRSRCCSLSPARSRCSVCCSRRGSSAFLRRASKDNAASS
jgi:hypothetical protein